MSRLNCFIRLHAKTIASAVAGGVAYLAVRFAIQLPPGVEAGIVAFVASAVTYFVPNECCDGECEGQSARPIE